MQSKISRRNFLGNASLGLGLWSPCFFSNTESIKAPDNFPHQVTIGTISVMDISVTGSPDMAQKVIGIMENIISISAGHHLFTRKVCISNLPGDEYNPRDVAERVPGFIVTPF